MTKSSQALLLTAVSFGALCAAAGAAQAQFKQTDLVSDIPGLAEVTDPNLKNSWGLSHLSGSPFWISNQGTGTATLFAVTGATATPANLFPPTPPGTNFVTVPPTVSAGFPGPTGQVANSAMTSFGIAGGPALFMFANLNGTVSAWNLSNVNSATHSAATVEASTPGASFTGLGINSAGNMLYAANGAGSGSIDVFNGSFQPVTLSSTAFATPSAIAGAGLVPFNVEDIGGNVWVTYAPVGHPAQTTAALGQGALAEFSESGVLEAMSPTTADSHLASPWGLTVAPASFGKFGGDVLVGNFSYDNSEINAFNPTTWAFEGSIAIDPGAGDTAGGLWSLTFGGGGMDGSPNVLYFTDGVNGEKDGLFGAITAVPEPSTWAMMLLGFGGLALFAARRRRAALAI
jgi:uncharacterized protein (TIGR03118 family)